MDRIENNETHTLALDLFDKFWDDSTLLNKDFRGREITKQLVRSLGSISANIEEGYGRGFGKEYARYLKIARGSARESKGWYLKSKRLISKELLDKRCRELDHIIAKLVKAIKGVESKY